MPRLISTSKYLIEGGVTNSDTVAQTRPTFVHASRNAGAAGQHRKAHLGVEVGSVGVGSIHQWSSVVVVFWIPDVMLPLEDVFGEPLRPVGIRPAGGLFVLVVGVGGSFESRRQLCSGSVDCGHQRFSGSHRRVGSAEQYAVRNESRHKSADLFNYARLFRMRQVGPSQSFQEGTEPAHDWCVRGGEFRSQ
jgi:hypothetical protein